MTRAVAILLLICAGAQAQTAPRPYKDARKQPSVFSGPGANDPEPTVKEILFGWFGPAEGPMWDAANQAIGEANKNGGYKGLPFRLVSGWAADPWRAGALHLTRMVFRDRVWALIAAANGDAVHLAEQVAVKALVTLVNAVATDRSVHTAGVPLMFSCVQGDHAIAPVLADAVKGRSVVIVSATDHDSRALLGHLKPLVRIAHHVEFEPGRAELAAGAVDEKPEAVIVIANASDSARAVQALRTAGYTGKVFGGPWMGRAEFRAAGLEYTSLSDQRRFPDYAAACAYDSVSILIAAVRRGGLNRERIRQAVKSLSPYDGASGRIEWDEFGQNSRRVVIRGTGPASAEPQP